MYKRQVYAYVARQSHEGQGSIGMLATLVSGWGGKVGPGHLDPTRAADALGLLRPSLAIPIHWGTYAPWHWRLSGHQPPLEDPAGAFAEAAARVAPGVEVRILQPGERTEL